MGRFGFVIFLYIGEFFVGVVGEFVVDGVGV